MGYLGSDSGDEEGGAEDTTTALFSEGLRWAEVKKAKKKSHLYMRGVVRRVGGTKAAPVAFQAEADAMFFWADREVQRAYPARHRVYLSVASAVNHEANSENTFSFAGRAFSKFRTKLASEQLCDTVVAVAGEKRKAAKPGDVQTTYKKLRVEEAARNAAAPAAAAPAAPPAAPAAPAAPAGPAALSPVAPAVV